MSAAPPEGSPLSLPVRRPVATAMVFSGIVILGLVAWERIPVELFPDLEGDELTVVFNRPGSEPEVVEREILLPLAARVSGLPAVAETWGEVRGGGGSFRVRFEPGTDLGVRQLELERLAAELARAQPRGTFLNVNARDTSAFSSFVMIVQASGGGDRHSLHDLVEERVAPRLAAVPGVSQVLTGGGAGRQVTVEVDPDRAAALGVAPEQVAATLGRSVRRLAYLGDLEEGGRRQAVVLDGRPRSVRSLASLRLEPERPVAVRHVATVELGPGREESLFRVDGEAAVAMIVFQEEGSNLVRLGRALRRAIGALDAEMAPQGVRLGVSFDGAELVEKQMERLRALGLSGFGIALVVLYLYLRRWRAVAVVAVAVPVSLLAALALLYLAGQSLNVLTLFGLAVGIGMLVDNSVVVYEAVERQLERRASPDEAAVEGVRRTVRAILAASVTTAVVFSPVLFVDFGDALVRGLLEVVSLAFLLPLAASLLVALGLVPLLARRLAAPAAVRRLEARRERRLALGGRVPPDRARALFSGALAAALRRPAGWLAGTGAAVLLTAVVAVPWVSVNTLAKEASRADTVQLAVRLAGDLPLDAAAGIFSGLEAAARGVEGVERVESWIREDGGSLTVHLVDEAERPATAGAPRVRRAVREAAAEVDGVEVLLPSEGQGGGGGSGGGLGALFGQGASEVTLSGPDSSVLRGLAAELAAGLESIPAVQKAWLADRPGQEEVRVIPDARALAALGLTGDQMLPLLRSVGREGRTMQTGFTLANGRELPLVVRLGGEHRSSGLAGLRRSRLSTPAGVVPLAAVADLSRRPAQPVIRHHDGRREASVLYALDTSAPASGPARLELEERIAGAVRGVHRPAGYAVEAGGGEEATSWFRTLLVPVVLLLLLVLAMTFESLTLPVLVLAALPLTLLGATWSLVLTGLPLDQMALVGAVALLGLTVNPAILLVDRMQQRALGGGRSAGAAALAAVKERARPVLMTSTTTIAGLWPLALSTGRENEIWPPFATLVMGGLATSTLLTLLVVPVGFVFLRRLDLTFGRLGPWVVLGWLAATAAVVAPLVATGAVRSLGWQLIITLLVAGLLLAAAVLLLRRPERPEPEAAEGEPPALEVRCLRKTYGLPGPVGRAWRLPETFAARAVAAGGTAFDPRAARERLPVWLVAAAAAAALAVTVEALFWQLAFLGATAWLTGRFARELRRVRGKTDALGRPLSAGPEGLAAAFLPWASLGLFAWWHAVGPRLAGEAPRVGWVVLSLLAVLLGLAQGGRHTALALARGGLAEKPSSGWLRALRALWRRTARRFFGLDLPRREVAALARVGFRLERGFVGVLGPNGAGKTTLLRLLTGILEPSRGRITLGGVPLEAVRRHLARWVGYLPQDAALPAGLTAREYLEQWALLYGLKPAPARRERIEALLAEVGLGPRADEPIGGFSGGMRQRVAVARTLLRLPPVIVVDEPTVGLDPRERIRFRNLLSRLARGRVVLFSTHVVEDVAVACERVIVLARGRLLYDGAPAELAHAARGRVWQVTLPPEELGNLPAGLQVADQVPEADGSSRLRLLARDKPHPAAEPAEPTLEEGYLLLVDGTQEGTPAGAGGGIP